MIVPEINKRSINNMISIDKKKIKLAFDDLKAIKVIKSRNINKKNTE